MKALFTPSLLTGDEMIDAHHKELFKRANDLFESIEMEIVRRKCRRLWDSWQIIQPTISVKKKN